MDVRSVELPQRCLNPHLGVNLVRRNIFFVSEITSLKRPIDIKRSNFDLGLTVGLSKLSQKLSSESEIMEFARRGFP